MQYTITISLPDVRLAVRGRAYTHDSWRVIAAEQQTVAIEDYG